MRPPTITIDPERDRPSRCILAAARLAPVLVLTGRSLAELADEVGGHEQAARYLTAVATEIGRPIGANVPTGPDTSRSLFVAPEGWTEARLRGWVAGRHEGIEAAFGPATPLAWEDV